MPSDYERLNFEQKQIWGEFSAKGALVRILQSCKLSLAGPSIHRNNWGYQTAEYFTDRERIDNSNKSLIVTNRIKEHRKDIKKFNANLFVSRTDGNLKKVAYKASPGQSSFIMFFHRFDNANDKHIESGGRTIPATKNIPKRLTKVVYQAALGVDYLR